MARMLDPYLQPRIWDGEMVIPDATNNQPRDGIFALIIDGAVEIRHLAKRGKKGFMVHDRRKSISAISYSVEEFQREVGVIGKVVLSGHCGSMTHIRNLRGRDFGSSLKPIYLT